jgi:hypothetical protein
MPPSVISHLNDISAKQKRQVSSDPIFRFGYHNHEVDINNGPYYPQVSGVHLELIDTDKIPIPDENREVVVSEDFDHDQINVDDQPEQIIHKAHQLPSTNKSPVSEVLPNVGEDLMQDFDADATLASPVKSVNSKSITEPQSIEQSVEMLRYFLRECRSN